jgi:glycosyltransferase involved in cell wall biosynthesis
MTNKLRVGLLAMSAIADDPRVRRQGDALLQAGFDVFGVGLAGAKSEPPAWPIHVVGEGVAGASTNRALLLELAGEVPASPRAARRRSGYDDACKAALPVLGSILTAAWPLALKLRPELARISLHDRVWYLGYFARLLRVKFDATRAEETYWSLSTQFADLFGLAQTHSADVWLANDWNTLPIAAHLALYQGGRYVYDTHELAYDEHSESAVWRLFQRPTIYALEHKYIGGARAVTAVSQSICDRLQTLHGLARAPLVVRNTPRYRAIPFRPTGDRIRVLYHGIIVPGRGLEACIRSVAKWNPQFDLTLRGPISEAYRNTLEAEVARAGVAGRVHFAAPVRMEELVEAASSFDVGLFALPGHSKHNLYALPNKLFEYAMAGLALCVSDMPEMKSTVESARMGLVFRGARPGAIATTINSLTREKIDAFKRHALQAAEKLCWEGEKERVVALYRDSFNAADPQADAFLAKLKPQMLPPIALPSAARLVQALGPQDVEIADYWRGAGAEGTVEGECLRIKTPPAAWHYTASLPIDLAKIDFQRERCWIRLRHDGVEGDLRASVFDSENNEIHFEAPIPEQPRAGELFMSVSAPSGTAFMVRNGQAAAPSQLLFRSLEIWTWDKPGLLSSNELANEARQEAGTR